jgi:type VI secretion system protein ImpM
MTPSRRSDRTPAHDDLPADPAERFAWFGKLPGVGDFVSRRMPYAVQQFWDHWCAEGVDALKAASNASGVDVWGGTPQWAFVLPAQREVPTGQLGVLAPSCDRVGRIFPFVVMTPLVSGQNKALLDRASLLGATWSRTVALAQESRLGVNAIDEGLRADLARTLATEIDADEDPGATLPQGLEPDETAFPWPELSREFELHGSESYWWTVPAMVPGFEARKHQGALQTIHFLGLCRPLGAQR